MHYGQCSEECVQCTRKEGAVSYVVSQRKLNICYCGIQQPFDYLLGQVLYTEKDGSKNRPLTVPCSEHVVDGTSAKLFARSILELR